MKADKKDSSTCCTIFDLSRANADIFGHTIYEFKIPVEVIRQCGNVVKLVMDHV
jgi:hypothetical protein